MPDQFHLQLCITGSGRRVLAKLFEPEDELLPGSSSPKDTLIELKSKGKTEAREQIEKLFNDKETSDMKIECDGEVFYCHQAILMARSDVFRAMFQAKMQETITGKVPITDISPDVIKGLLQYIYTGATDKNILKEKPGELLYAAEKYQMTSLKKICELQLCWTLEVGNSIKSLVMGDMYRASRLRRMALRMVAKNLFPLLFRTEEYRYLNKFHPDLTTEVCLAMLEEEDDDI